MSRVTPTQRTHPRSGRGEIPRIIHQTWMTSQLPSHYAPWVTSWMKKNPTWQYWLWTDDDARQLAGRYHKQYVAMYDGYTRNINRADAMRYFVLDKYGGVYADIDVEYLRPLNDIISNHSCISRANRTVAHRPRAANVLEKLNAFLQRSHRRDATGSV